MKHICELSKKGFEKNQAKILAAVQNPEFICRKCGRVSNNKGRLCKPVSIDSLHRGKA